MIRARIDAAWRAFCHPAAVHHPKTLTTDAMEVVASTMDAAVALCRYTGAAEEDEWWMGYLGAHGEIRSNLIALKAKLLMEMAYPEETAP